MIFPKEITVRSGSKDFTANRQHLAATTALEKSCFYNKSLSKAFKKHYVFDYPNKK